MLRFYQQALFALLGVCTLSLLLGYLGFKFTFFSGELIPSKQSPWPWVAAPASDQFMEGNSTIELTDAEVNLSFRFNIQAGYEYPFADVSMAFVDADAKPARIDLSRFDAIRFRVKCAPANTLSFTAFSVEKSVTDLEHLLTYRPTITFFSCNEQWSNIELDLKDLETAQWWFDMFKLDLSHQHYELDQVARLTFGSSFQSPRDVLAQVQLHDIVVIGRDMRALYIAIAVIVLLWIALGIWLLRSYTAHLTQSIRDKMQSDLPLVAYQQLSLDQRHDKDKSAILRYMATEYANEALNQDAMVKALGISRTKINDILKAEIGHTFITYLNKLRLTEAARLLRDCEELNISEIAYSVGYKNVSYFNKLFKEEYGCTPKTFKTLCDKPEKQA